MAIVNSIFMGDARKSAGNGTFRTVRGRTIVSQKVSKKGSIVGSLSKNQFALAVISRFASIHAADIVESFDPTTYGSARNAFFKLNYDAMKTAVNGLWFDSLKQGAAKLPSDAEIEQAIADYATANPQAIYRVKKAGYPVVYLTGAWEGTTNPITWGEVTVKGSSVKTGDDNIKLATGDSITIAYTGEWSDSIVISASVANGEEANATLSTLSGSSFATLDSAADGVATYTVASGANNKYLRKLSMGSATLLTLVATGGSEFT